MMLMVNSILINVSTGIGYGFEELLKSGKGRVYLSGRWQVNDRNNGIVVGYVKYYLMEFMHLIAGLIPVVILVAIFGPKHWILFIFGNIGAFFSGYFYTSKTYKHLFDYQIIREAPKISSK